MGERNTDSVFGRLISELQRRRVFRTAALYIVGAWLVMQVADVVFPALGIPERALRFVLFGAIFGFPVAVVFGWFYDVSMHGIRRTEAVDPDAPGGTRSLRGTDYVILAALGVVVAAILYNAIGGVAEVPRDRWEQDRNGPPMLAVLPFVATNPSEESASFAAGVHDDLLTQLSKIQSIRVISRTSVMGYRDTVRNIREIGEALGADTILEGGVQTAGNRIRINAQLIDARTDEHLWAETYDRDLTLANIFDVQSDIAHAITSAMRATLTESDETALAAIPTENMAAYRAYHRAIETERNHGRIEDRIEYLEEAVALDPNFTHAWAELIGSLSLLTFNRTEHESERVQQAEAALEHIRSIAPDSPDYVTALAYYTYYTLQDYDRAYQLILRAQEMVPSDPRLLEIGSFIQRRQGDFDGRIESLTRARELDPKDPKWLEVLARALVISHYYEDARDLIEKSESEDYWIWLYYAYLQLEEHQSTEQFLRDVEELQNEHGVVNDYQSLWDAHLLNRSFREAEELLSQLPGTADDPKLIRQYMRKLRMSVLTYYFLGEQEKLATGLSKFRAVLDSRRQPDGSLYINNDYLNLALVEALHGNTEESVQLVSQWRRIASSDLAELMGGRSESCRIYGLVGAAEEAVDCLREAFREPSFAFPFVERYLPSYDAIRDAPEFLELLADIDEGM